MKRIVLALTLAGLTACASQAARGTANTDPQAQRGSASPSREGAVYSAVIRQLVLVDHGLRQGSIALQGRLRAGAQCRGLEQARQQDKASNGVLA